MIDVSLKRYTFLIRELTENFMSKKIFFRRYMVCQNKKASH